MLPYNSPLTLWYCNAVGNATYWNIQLNSNTLKSTRAGVLYINISQHVTLMLEGLFLWFEIIKIIIIINKIYIAPYIICKEIALRRFTNIIKCKIALHEHSTRTYLNMKYLYDVFITNMLQEKDQFLPSSRRSKGRYTSCINKL